LTKALVLLAHGSADRVEDIGDFVRSIRGGRPTSDAIIEDVQKKFIAIGGSPFNRIAQSICDKHHARTSAPTVFATMRWHPRIDDVFARLHADGADDWTLLPLAPFSTHIYLRAAHDSITRLALANLRVSDVGAWNLHPPLLDALTRSLLAANPDAQTHVLFSAHSLPQIAIDKGDPYATLVSETAHAIVERASLTSPWSIAYQSQGADGGNWLGPTIAQSIAQLDGVKKVLVFPIGFLSDHLETLYDLDIEAKQIIESRALAYARVPALNDSDTMINVLESLVAHAD
jgi:ferrochelatase